jgi:hypothetical protein
MYRGGRVGRFPNDTHHKSCNYLYPIAGQHLSRCTIPFILFYMPIQQTKEFLAQKPIELSHTEEHRLVKRKWWAVVLLIIGGLILAGKMPVPLFIPYIFFFFGHAGMLHSFWYKRDIPMVMVNAVWLCIDLIGTIRWF